jgi:hypothetical protein
MREWGNWFGGRATPGLGGFWALVSPGSHMGPVALRRHLEIPETRTSWFPALPACWRRAHFPAKNEGLTVSDRRHGDCNHIRPCQPPLCPHVRYCSGDHHTGRSGHRRRSPTVNSRRSSQKGHCRRRRRHPIGCRRRPSKVWQ